MGKGIKSKDKEFEDEYAIMSTSVTIHQKRSLRILSKKKDMPISEIIRGMIDELLKKEGLE